MALAHGYALPFEAIRRTGVLAQNTADATNRATADGATKEAAGNCLDARALEVQQRTVVQPSILVVPQLTRNGVVMNQLPDTRTNFIQNNTMVGATGSVLPTTWSIVAPPSGITIGYSASGQTTAADGTLVDYVDVTVSGTATAAGNFNLRPEPVSSAVSGNLLFAAGMTYTASFYMALLSGSVSGVSPNYQIQEVSGTTFVSGTSLDLSAITSSLTRYSVTRQMVGTGGANRVRTRYGHAIASGQVLNYTIRIASPQLEKGSVATPIIRTVSGFVTVDMLGVARNGAPPDFTFTRATTATRVNASGLIQSVASGVPRIDWLGQSCPALLVEASGQNVCLHSEVFNNAFHFPFNLNAFGSGSVANTTATLDPYGTNVADYIQENSSASAQHSIIDIFAGNVSGTTYTWSVFAKAAERTIIQLANNAGGGGTANFNLITGVATLTNGVSCSMQNYGNGWYRCILTYNSTATGNHNVQIRLCDASGNTTYNGTGNQGAYIFGAQLEAGSVATTYIPTTTAAVSRAADVISASGALVSGLIGQTEGTIYVEVDVKALQGSVAKTFIDIGATNNRIFIGFTSLASNTIRLQIDTSASPVRVDIRSAVSSAGIIKIAAAYQSGNCVLYVNGVAGTVSANDSLSFSTLSNVFIGQTIAGTAFLNDRIRAAALYTTRLSNDQLANLTALT